MKPAVRTLAFGGLLFAGIIALQYFGIGGTYLVWAAILACLGMHFFMMGRGGCGSHQQKESAREAAGAGAGVGADAGAGAEAALKKEKQGIEKQNTKKHGGHGGHGGGCCH